MNPQIIKESILLSGTDGIITVFNLLVGLNASNFDISSIYRIIIIAIIGDAISMGISYMNSKDDQYSFDEKVYGAIINIIAFALFGGLCLIIFLLLTNKPSVSIAYLSIILPLLILSYFEKSDIKLTFWLGLLGSSIVYLISKILL